jgi:hypothetical protein
MSSLVETIRMIVRRELASIRPPALGSITAVNPHSADDDDYNDEVDVALQYEDLTLPHVPVAVAQPGTVAPLKVGDLVLVQFLNGDLQQPLVTACFHHADDRPPVHEKDELIIEHRVPDNQLRFGSDGSITLRCEITDDDAKVTIKLAGDDLAITCKTLTVTGDAVFKDGDVTVEKGDLTVKAGKVIASNQSTKTTIEGSKITGATGSA